MELDSSNIKRLINIYQHYLKKNWRIFSIRFMTYAYMFGGFCFMCLLFSYNVRIAVKPLSYFAILLTTLCAYIFYVIVNHIFIRFVISHKTLLIFDLLTFFMLICITASDVLVENN